jgi:hypothetical protein
MANKTRLIRKILASDRRRYRRPLRACAGGVALLLLFWVGAMSPHLVHHLFDDDHGQVCLMSEQANTSPGLPLIQPRLVLPQTPQLWFPSLLIAFPQAPRAAISSARAPPSLPV